MVDHRESPAADRLTDAELLQQEVIKNLDNDLTEVIEALLDFEQGETFFNLPGDISLRVEDAGVECDRRIYESPGFGTFSDIEIRKALLRGHIRIYPFDELNLNGSSYDCRVGEYFYLTDKVGNRTDYNPYDVEDVERYFNGPYQAETNAEWSERQRRLPWKNIPLDHPIHVLNPGERILNHTREFIGINSPGTTQMQARSSYGRNGEVVCKDAGWGDPGYVGRWTMEIQNDNDERIVLPVNVRAPQIVFLTTGAVERDYGKKGKYYRTSNLRDDIKNWTPDTMLPKTYKDEILPLEPLFPNVEVKLR